MIRSAKSVPDTRRPKVVEEEDDADDLLYQTALLLGDNPKTLAKYRKGTAGGATQSKYIFVPAILQTVSTPSTLKITNMRIGDKVTTLQMIPVWFQPTDREAALKDMVCPDDVSDKRSYETVACYRAAIGKTNNFNRNPLDVSEQSTETLIISLDAFAKQFGGEVSFTNNNLSFENSVEQMASGIANMGSVHLLATDSLPTAVFTFKISLDYKKDLARTPETMGNFVSNFATAVAKTLGCEKDYVRVMSVEKSSGDVRTSQVKFGLTIPDQQETKKLADTLQTLAQSGLKKDKILKYVKPAHYDYRWQSILSYLQLKPSDFDPRYNLDYSKPGMPEQQTRGGEPYYLPIGWYRHGLNVSDKYGSDNVWLGSSGAEGEWPVAFHGTHSGAVSNITQGGLSVGKAKRDLMQDEAVQQLGPVAKGTGLYLATHCNGGSYPQYTQPFTVTTNDKTENYCVVFQCRVRPKSFSTHTSCVKTGHAWRVIDPTAIRPYGLLLKKEEAK